MRAPITALLLAGAVVAAPATFAASSADSPPRRVLSTANIFGAGSTLAPAPGGGGGGTLPPGWRLEPGGGVVTFPSVTGLVTPIQGLYADNGPQGDGAGPTNVESWLGISGIVNAKNGMFLVGVFLGDAAPANSAPPRLDFTDREAFDTLAPAIGQTFLVGDGKGRKYVPPAGATRLYVGFADAAGYQGRPGWYGNNAGQLEVVATGVGASLDTTPPQLFGVSNRAVKAPRGKKTVLVRYFVRAADDVDGTVPAECTPASGTPFRVGRTTIACSASDQSGNTKSTRFVVTVKLAR